MEGSVTGGWHVDKRISIGHIGTTLTVLLALIAWSLRIEGQVDRNDLRIANNEKAIVELRVAAQTQYSEIIRRLERLDEKSTAHMEQHLRNGE